MINRLFVGVVLWSWRHWAAVIALAVAATVAFGWMAATTISLDTDESKLLADDLPFKRGEDEMAKAFPSGSGGTLVVVVDAPTPGQAEAAADALMARVAERQDLFIAVNRPAGTDFFKREGLLYLSVDELQALSDRLVEAQPMVGTLARDPSLRGMLGAVDMMLEGVARGEVKIADITPALKRFIQTAATVVDGKPQPLDWTELMGSATPLTQPRAIVMARAKLDYTNLTPGEPAENAIRFAAAELGYVPANGYRVRLTGGVALTDDNFATVAEGCKLSMPLSFAAVVLILFGAVRSKRLVAIIFATLVAGLAATGAFAAATVRTLNPISVAFAVMFVGIAVDFAIQFVIRFRDIQTKCANSESAMEQTAASMAGPLTLAAVATAAGFLSFLPTKYVGVSQLGLVAGGGMLIALVVDVTLLPALLRLARSPAEREVAGVPFGRTIDRFLARHPRPVVVAAAVLALVGLALAPRMRLDFNPLNLQNPKAESISTLMDLAANPDTSPYSIDVLAPTLDAAKKLADGFEKLGEVDHAVTLANLVPGRQDDKLAILADLANLYGPVLDPAARLQPPTVDEDAAALARTAVRLARLDDPDGMGRSLAGLLDSVRAAGTERTETLGKALLGGLPENLTVLETLLHAKPVQMADLPADLVRDWVAVDGRQKISVWPKGDMNDGKQLRHFVHAVQAIAPDAAGMPVSMVEAGKAVMASFRDAGLAALVAIAILLGVMLRRVLDALLVLLPLVLGGLYTVIGCVALGMAINFANIIALPLLLGIGVAFNIYFVVNWRKGVRDHLETSTSRAVLFSALTTSSAFGSLAVSPHVGTASMGMLLFLSVALSVATTFLVLPAIFHLLNKGKTTCNPAD